MVSVDMARKLKAAGVVWQPVQGDLFVVPDSGMDQQVFVINDMATIIENLRGTPAVTFHGTPEWALDYIQLGDTVWLPHEEQLRALLESRLAAEGEAVFDLLHIDRAYTCRFAWRGQQLAFRESDASDAYAAAVLQVWADSQDTAAA